MLLLETYQDSNSNFDIGWIYGTKGYELVSYMESSRYIDVFRCKSITRLYPSQFIERVPRK